MKSAHDSDVESRNSDANERFSDFAFAFWTVTAAFGCYFCMYFFRKPFTAARFHDADVWGLSFKIVLVMAQVAGYMLSKFIGIKIIAEMPPHRRAITMLWLIFAAEGALILFGLIPRPWNTVCLFLNGLPLGMVFGLVQGFLEGRRLTELLVAGLCSSFILADGMTKSVGTWLLAQGITEDWMPCVAGLLFLFPFGVCVAILARTPPPTDFDIAARSKRYTMDRSERMAFVRKYGVGLIPIVLMYLLVTIVRSIRADFAPEIWKELGNATAPSIFTRSETVIAFCVLVVNGAAVLIINNRRAFLSSLATCGLGFLLMTAALLIRSTVVDSGFSFMVLIGLGLYLPYVAVHTTLLERMLAMTGERGNVGFLMYVADSVGYLGYVVVMVVRNFHPSATGVLGLLTWLSWLTIVISIVCLSTSWTYFSIAKKTS
jgi:Family of unknown function (DUF5690)